MVMICHVSGTLGTVIGTPLGGIGVAMFLFLSGYGLNESNKKKGLQGFWKKKIFRVFIPYLIIESIRQICLGGKNIWEFVLDVTGIQSDYWYISILLRCYIVYYLATRFATKYRLLILLVFSLYLLFFTPNIQSEQAFSFLAGFLISENIDVVRTLSKKQYGIISMCCFVFGCSFLFIKQLPEVRTHFGDCYYGMVECGIKLPLALSVISGLSLVPVLLRSRFLLFAGMISYELYLIHFQFYTKLEGNMLYILIFVILSFLSSYVFYKFNNWITARYCR